MRKNDILDQIFTATCKLELMQTVLGVSINMTEKEEIVYNRDIISDFLHIALNGICRALEILNKIQENGVEKNES